MAGTNTTTQDKDFLDNATELVDKVGRLGAAFTGNPLLMAGVELLGKGIKSWAAGRNIDTGPFDARMASVDATVTQARTAYEEYRKRHGGE
jgi:hypothetical protein